MQPIHVLYGTETYNSQDLAERTGEAIAGMGLPVVVLDLGEFDPASLPELGVVLVITSTFGAGEPPANAADTHDWLMADDAPALAGLRFAVCGLGDRAYPDFCQCGKDFDAAFARLGGQRIAPRQDCDLDFEAAWESWLDNVLGALGAIDLNEVPAPTAAHALVDDSQAGEASGSWGDGEWGDASSAGAEGGAASGARVADVHVLYGTETYNSQDLAERAGEAIAGLGLPVVVAGFDEVDLEVVPRLHALLVITSTFGAGEPPANAAEAHAWLTGDDAPSLAGVNFAVCGLGDRAYPDFCQCGKDFDAAFERLGGRRLAPRADCDLDFEASFEAWLDRVLGALRRLAPPAAEARTAVQATVPPAAQASAGARAGGRGAGGAGAGGAGAGGTASAGEGAGGAASAGKGAGKAAALGTRKNPFFATVIDNHNLNAPGGDKETRHVALSLAGSGIDYRVGDSLGLFPRNDPELAYRVLWATGLRGDEAVEVGGEWLYLRDALIYRLDITWPDPKLVNLAAEHGAQGRDYFQMLVGDSKARKAFLAEHHVVDILGMARAGVEAAVLCKALRPLAPRLYSISSSPKAHPGEVHLTVDVVRYAMHGLDRKGISSCFLAERAVLGAQVPVFLQKSADFHLTDDDGAPIIMVGPGTGLAPFRAFLEEREVRGSQGYSWLFFGARQSSTDFLYREQVQGWVDKGVLTRLDLAFSRDQKEKIYVQDRMWQNGADFWAWLDAGSYVYICGDASRMAKDVHQTMVRIISTYGGRTAEQAEAYLEDMRKAGRYARDVY